MPACRIADDPDATRPNAASDSPWSLFRPFSLPGLGVVTLREATAYDHSLIEGLYLESMAVLLTALGDYDRGAVKRRLRAVHRIQDARIVLVDGRAVGWLEVAAKPERLTLHQIHLVADVRGRGLGTRLVAWLKVVAQRSGRPIVLFVIRNNPARRLYERSGFRVTRRSGNKWEMRFDPPQA